MSITNDEGNTVFAWCGPWNGEEFFHVHWRDSSEKPKHQPFRIRLWEAPGILEQLAAFARYADQVLEK